MSKAGRRGSGEAGRRKGGEARRGAGRGAGRGAQRAPERAPLRASDDGATNPLQAQPIEFVGSFPDPLVEVDPRLPEIAFIGRSNVGKSSLLNSLVAKPGLARVSGSPGKTTLLNFYRLPRLYLVDLPGYGFAKASKGARAGYRKLVSDYLRHRPTLVGVVWLLDIRRQPSGDDRQMQELLADSGRPTLAVLTKADKLTRSGLRPRVLELAGALGLQEDEVLPTSSRSGLGITELAASIIATSGGETS